MRDEMDARIWNAHSDQFSLWLDGAVASLRSRLPRPRVPAQLVAGLFALSLTVITFGGTAA